MTKRSNSIDRHVAKRLKQARIACGLTQREASKLIKLNVNNVLAYEAVRSRCPPGRLLPLARVYHKPIQWFFRGAPK